MKEMLPCEPFSVGRKKYKPVEAIGFFEESCKGCAFEEPGFCSNIFRECHKGDQDYIYVEEKD